jgi:diguanylate cyclase (GGDEF)-like protein
MSIQLSLLTALFDSLLVFNESGKVIHRVGGHHDVDNVFTDPRFSSLNSRLQECIQGRGFEAYFSMDDSPKNRWRGAPFVTDGGERAGILCSEAIQGETVRARPAGSDFDFVLANMNQGFLRRNAKGRIAYINDHLANQLELSTEDAIGRHVGDFIPGIKSKDGRYETEYVTHTGVRRRGIISTAKLVGSGERVVGFIDVLTDITAGHAFRTRLVAEVQKMSHLAFTDPLTGQANRAEFQSELQRLLENEPFEPFAMVIVDLDRFKDINDHFGHAVGDEALIEFGRRLRQAVRETDLVARIGGDEFAILLNRAPKDFTEEFVERLIERLNTSMRLNDEEWPITASFGWAHSDDGAEGIFQRADRRMYKGKRAKQSP